MLIGNEDEQGMKFTFLFYLIEQSLLGETNESSQVPVNNDIADDADDLPELLNYRQEDDSDSEDELESNDEESVSEDLGWGQEDTADNEEPQVTPATIYSLSKKK